MTQAVAVSLSKTKATDDFDFKDKCGSENLMDSEIARKLLMRATPNPEHPKRVFEVQLAPCLVLALGLSHVLTPLSHVLPPLSHVLTPLSHVLTILSHVLTPYVALGSPRTRGYPGYEAEVPRALSPTGARAPPGREAEHVPHEGTWG